MFFHGYWGFPGYWGHKFPEKISGNKRNKQTLRKFYENWLKSKLMANCTELSSCFFKSNPGGMAIVFLILKNNMKTKAIVAGLVAAAAALTTYYIIKRRNQKRVEPIQRTHHLTDVFSKAKSYSK